MSLRPDTLCLHKLARMRYLSLPTAPHCQVTYVWINQDGTNPKAKTRILDSEPQSLHDVPQWYSTYYLDCVYEMTLIPVQMFRDPFLLDPHKLVLCDTRQLNGAPAPGNRRPECAEAMEAVKDQKPWFGFEQEYLLKALDGLPFGWASTFQDNNTASAHVGLNKVLGRDVSISHCNACLYAGVKITGITGEVIPAQWEFQVGPCEGLALGDHAWMARYILHRVCEDFGVVPSFHPKPVEHPRWASGGHMNFSTENMRAEGGITHIHTAIKRLAERHTEHIEWEFQVGPCEGLELGEHAWMARYILHGVCEDFGVVPSFHPKPVEHPRWATAGHMNFSTENMRAEGASHTSTRRSSTSPNGVEVYGNNRLSLNSVGLCLHFCVFTFMTSLQCQPQGAGLSGAPQLTHRLTHRPLPGLQGSGPDLYPAPYRPHTEGADVTVQHLKCQHRQETARAAGEECLGHSDYQHRISTGLCTFSPALLPVHQLLHLQPRLRQTG
ncbi:glutamine synthetase-like isoform X2 [Periophthalmus magnuspinnatus]|uniref:glutamine synthetase-like isoform X2 n=1 Tax=Periophthalmus magnuspinnatus TaxID=409849 RepID=UPI0024366029|nr:glutamine synthetase-like isoform X2 [Periophthalmus magnuspinnatus]